MKIKNIDSIKSKEEARGLAIKWQAEQSEKSTSYGELAEWSAFFSALAEKFDLQEEFKENGIMQLTNIKKEEEEGLTMGKCHCGTCEKCLNAGSLAERMEAARVAGKRDEFLRLKAKMETTRESGVQKQHAEHVERIKKAFPLGSSLGGRTITGYEDICGSMRGWVQIVTSDGGKTDSNDAYRIRAKAYADSQADAFMSRVRRPRSGRVKIGEYSEALDALVRAMRLEHVWTCEQWQHNNIGSWDEEYSHIQNEAIADGFTDEEAEEKRIEAQHAAQSDAFDEYVKKLKRAVNYVLGFSGLELEEVKGVYYIAPVDGTSIAAWHAAADKMAEVITGYGAFEYRDGQELKDAGPYKTYSDAILQHLHWLRHGPAVYGGGGYDFITR